MKEFDYFKKIMSFNSKKDLYNNYFSWIYPFTNENIKGYYELFDKDTMNYLILKIKIFYVLLLVAIM